MYLIETSFAAFGVEWKHDAYDDCSDLVDTVFANAMSDWVVEVKILESGGMNEEVYMEDMLSWGAMMSGCIPPATHPGS